MGDLRSLDGLCALGEVDKGKGENHQNGDNVSLEVGHIEIDSCSLTDDERGRGGVEGQAT